MLSVFSTKKETCCLYTNLNGKHQSTGKRGVCKGRGQHS
jgi:hypothetical protein